MLLTVSKGVARSPLLVTNRVVSPTPGLAPDALQVTFRQLLDEFFKRHDPTALNRQGNDVGTQYRGAFVGRSGHCLGWCTAAGVDVCVRELSIPFRCRQAVASTRSGCLLETLLPPVILSFCCCLLPPLPCALLPPPPPVPSLCCCAPAVACSRHLHTLP